MLRLAPLSSRPLKILNFDCETRKVGFISGGNWGPDGCEIIALACSWVGSGKVEVWLQGYETLSEILEHFVEKYNQADIVSGHYIRKFDLPIVNGSLLEHGMAPLSAKLVSDTKCDLMRKAGISASQENLAEMIGLPQGKYHMNDAMWREANRLTEKGVELTRKRVVSDVRQSKALRVALLKAGALGSPRMWSP